ncbi:pilus assembly protein TadG-related protein [Demequina globuliformis]|uniref:pilus assembly protein TadG-related protein n=1 Tax=Demequina globuliformis TaxID=676202 RepID=UPI00078056A0|nr:pilus assembly protein TadG-related protein [Demequina globuliformis]
MWSRERDRADAGSAAVVMVAVICVALAAASVALAGSQMLIARFHARVGADQAALAGAMVAREHAAAGMTDPGAVCAEVVTGATSNDATVTSCTVDGAVVTVHTASGEGVVRATAWAVAGPADSG